jgi:hypothetical protein
MSHELTSVAIGNGAASVEVLSDTASLEQAAHFAWDVFRAQRQGIDLDVINMPVVAVKINGVTFGSTSIQPVLVNHCEFLLVELARSSMELELEEAEAYFLLLERTAPGDGEYEFIWNVPDGANLVHLHTFEDEAMEPFNALQPTEWLTLLLG